MARLGWTGSERRRGRPLDRDRGRGDLGSRGGGRRTVVGAGRGSRAGPRGGIQVEDDGEDQQGSQQQATPAGQAGQTGQEGESGDEEQQAEAASATSRSDEEIAERVAEIERRQDERRPRPVFEVAGPFPWEWPLIGIAGGLVVLSGLLLVRVLTARD